MPQTVGSGGGRIYSVPKLWKLADAKLFKWVRIAPLLEGWPYRDPSSGWNEDRYRACDPSIPAILGLDGRLYDGRHRLVRLRDGGFMYATAVWLTLDELQACLVS